MFRSLYVCHEVTQCVVVSASTSHRQQLLSNPWATQTDQPPETCFNHELNENCIIFQKMATLFLQLMRGSRGCLSFITFLALNL